jgi:phosphoglycolate phosphatase
MKLTVFDLDGTLVDSRRDLADSINVMLVEIGRVPLPVGEIGDMVGEGARVLVRRALAVTSRAAGDASSGAGRARPDEDRALRRFLELYDTRLLEHTRPYRGVPELLAELAPVSTLAVLTNKPREASERILDGLGLRRHFGEVVGGDGPLPRKPDPAALLELMHRAGAGPDDTMLVGDSRVDLETARNARTHVCLAGYGFGFRFDPAELEGIPVARHPGEILALVRAASL